MFETIAEFVILLVSVLMVIILKMLITSQSRPIFNVYRRPNGFYWPKVFFIYIILMIRKFRQKFGKLDEKFESSQKSSFRDKAVDATYFIGCSTQGDYFFLVITKRNNKLIDNFLLIKIVSSELGVLETTELPVMSEYITHNDDDNIYSIKGLKALCSTPIKKWRITYNGKLKETHDVQIDFEWISDFPRFNFEKDFNTLALSKNIALEQWSQNYFDTLTKFQKIHYEQFGKLKANITIDKKKYCLSLNSCRGYILHENLDWRFFHRYILHYIFAEDGDCFVVGKICAPVLFSNLTVGYIYSGKVKKLYPIQNCDLEMYQHGEEGDPPTDYGFSFVAGCQGYTVQVNVINTSRVFIVEGSEFVEAFCAAKVSGKKAWGVCKWQYKNK